MSDAFRPVHASSPPPVRRRWPVALAILLAFAAGLAVAWWGARWAPRLRQPAVTSVIAPGTARTTVTRPAAIPVAAPAPPSAAPAVDPNALAVLSARADLLAEQLTTIEGRAATTSTDAETASGQAGRAEAMLLAAAARRAVDRGVTLGGLEAPLRQRFGAIRPRAVGAVLQAARVPVTLDSLRTGLDALADVLVAGGGDWWDQARRQLAMLVVVHRAGTPSPVPAERLAHARRLLDAGAVEPALAVVSRLPGAARATDWIAAARRYVEVQRALDLLDAAAIRGEASPAPVAPREPPPPATG